MDCRLMTFEDTPHLMDLVQSAGWNQCENDWLRYMRMEPEGCFVLEKDRKIIGSVTTICYEHKIGWIGMVLVHHEYRRQGIGTDLMNTALDYLKPKVDTIGLDATDQGKPVYERLGFKAAYSLNRLFVKNSEQHKDDECLKMSAQDIDKIVQFDAACFGARRMNVISELYEEFSDVSFYTMTDKKISGYIMANCGRNAWHIGPFVAKRVEEADRLLKTCLSCLPEQTIFVDVPVIDQTLTLFNKFNFVHQRDFVRMFLGNRPNQQNLSSVYATARAEKG